MSPLGAMYYKVCRSPAGHVAARSLIRALRRIGIARPFHMPFDALDLDHAAVAELMRLWSRIHWSSGDGMMPPDQLLAIYRLAAEWPGEGDTVELGAWTGLTTSYLAAACRSRRKGRVFAVDTFEGTMEGGGRYPSIERMGGSTRDAFHERIRRADVEGLVEPLVGLTTEVADRYPGGPIRLLIIDADHSYDGVRADFEHWSPKVAPGGLIVFHDYQMTEVARFVNECVVGRDGFTADPGVVVPNVIAFTKSAPIVPTRHGGAGVPARRAEHGRFIEPSITDRTPTEASAR